MQPFGHSSTQAAILSSPYAGFSSIFFGRIDYEDQRARRANKTLEMIWQASPSLPDRVTFAGTLPNLYMPPSGLCWDIQCMDANPINDDPTINGVNVAYFVDLFVETALAQSNRYQGTNV
jgi:lysosomal alpha-mannosidase